MSDKNLSKQVVPTYIKMIENSVGTKMFNSAFVKNLRTGLTLDVLNDGELSCAFFVSGVLNLVGLLERPHSTVKTVTEKIEESSGWEEITNGQANRGDVLVWETVVFEDGSQNEHIGFFLDPKNAVSTSYTKKCVTTHSPDFDGKRKINRIFRPLI